MRRPSIPIALRFKTYFKVDCGEATESAIDVQHEPKRVADKGAPDFKITKSGLILGYVENKAIGENLDKVLKSDADRQIQEPVQTTLS